MKNRRNPKSLLGMAVFFMLQFYAFGQSPGGVAAAAWYKTDAQSTVFSDAGVTNATDNTTVQQWNEYLGTGHDLIQNTAGSRPIFSNTTTLVNFHPTLTFDLDYLEYQPGTGVNIIDRANGTLYTAGYFNTVGAAGIMGFDATMDYPGLHTSNNGLDNLLFYTGGPGYQGLSSGQFNDNSYFIAGANWENGAGGSAAYASSIVSLDGVRSSYNNTELFNANLDINARDIRVGRDSNWGGMNGQVNEVIIFETALTSDEMDRVESYLSIKYGTTYASGASDYKNSSSAVVWNATDNVDYNENIFGIARDDVSELYQKQSKSTNQDQRLVIGAGNSLFDTNAANTNTLTDGQFLMVGDNGLEQNLKTPLLYTAGANGETNFRFEAIWKAENTGNVGTVTIAWPKRIDNLYLVQSADGTMDATDTFTPMTDEVTVNGEVYNTATVTLADGEFFTFAGYAYAPGGVVDGLLMWHKADDGTTTAGQKNVWQDVSVNGRDVFQPNNTGYEPELVLDAAYTADNKNYFFNFNPFYYFDGTDDFFYNEGEVYFPATNSAGSTYGVMMNSESGGFRTAYGWGDDDPNFLRLTDTYYFTRDNGTVITQNVNATTLPAHIGGMNWQGAANGVYLNINGQIYGNETYNIGAIQSAVNFSIGSEGADLSGNGNEVHQGGLPEVFAYSIDHSNSGGDELQRINSYLAIKYGITLSNEDGTGVPSYLSSNSTTVWDATANSIYNNNIIGIANDTPSALYQKQSKSVNEDQKLIIGNGSSLFDTNADNTNMLTDGQFLVVGDNGLKQGLSVPLVYTAGANGETNFRFEAIWKAQNTNSVGNVTIAWPKRIENFYLVQSADETIDATDTFTPMTDEVTINGEVFNAATATLADGEFFTFAGFAFAPGGVIDDLRVWLRADEGFLPDTWIDHSIHANDYTQTNASRQPFVAAEQYNFNPIVDFGGSVSADGRFMVVPSGQPFSTNGLSGTFFTATLTRQGGTSGYRDILGFGATTTGTGLINADSPAITKLNDNIVLYSSITSAFSDEYPDNELLLTDVSYTVDVAGINYGLNGRDASTAQTRTAGGSLQANGSVLGSQPQVNNGLIGEVIAYERDLTPLEKQKIRSYLAIKNGMTLIDAIGGTYDYLDSQENEVWSGSTSNSAYHNNVFGIGYDEISALHQKQSTSINNSQKLIIGNGSSLFDANADNTNNLTEGQFLLVGDNGERQGLSIPLTYTAGANGDVNFRFESIWKTQNTNNVGNVTVAWPVGVSNLYLVQSADETFDATDTFTPMGNEVTVNGMDYNTATVTLVDGEFFTLAGYGFAPAGVVNALSYWYRADKNADNTGAGTDVTSWTDYFSGTVISQLGTNNFPKYVEGTVDYFNFNPGVNFTANTQTLGNINVQTVSELEFDIFTLTKEGLTDSGGNPRVFSSLVDNDQTSGSINYWDGIGILADERLERVNNAYGSRYLGNPGGITWSTTIPSIMYHKFTDVSLSKGLNGDANGTEGTHGARGFMNGGHAFGDTRFSSNGSDNAGFIGDIGETIIYGAGNLSDEERRRVDSYLAIKYGITLSRVETDHYLGSTASATSIIWNGTDNTSFNNNIFGVARSDIGGFEQKVSKSVNTGTILTIATDDDYVSGNLDASRTSFTNDETYVLFGDNEATGETSLAIDPCTGETLDPAVSTTNKVWRVETTNMPDAIWLEADLNAYTFNSDIQIWVADDENFTTNLVKIPAASYEAGIATFNVLFPEGVKYIKFAGVVTPSQCDVCTGGTFIFKTGRSWDTLAERTNNVIDSETTGTTDQGDLIVDMDVADPANVEYGPTSTPRAYGRWMISRRYDNQNVALTHTIDLNQAVAGASFQISNINTYLNNANRFTVEGYDCDGNLVMPKIKDAYAPSTATTYEIQDNEVVGTKPYRGLTSLYSTVNVRFDRVIQSIVIVAEVDRTNTRNTLRSLNVGDISFECAKPLPPTEDNVTMVQDFTQSEDVPSCLETTMRMRFENSNCDTRTVNISQTLPTGLEFVEDTYNDSEFTTPPAYIYNANTFTLNGLELPSGTTYLYINVRSTDGTTATYDTSSSFTVQETGNSYNSIDPAGNADTQVSFEASGYTAPALDVSYTVNATCLEEGTPVTYTLNFDNQEASAITGATLNVYYALGQEIASVTLNNGITGVHGFGPVGESYIEMTNVTLPTGTSSIEVQMDITSDIFTDEPLASSVFQLITEPGNPCAEESPMISNVVELGVCVDCPDPLGIDSDGDGIDDACDLDSDNDGILDADECPASYLVSPVNTSSITTSGVITNGNAQQLVDGEGAGGTGTGPFPNWYTNIGNLPIEFSMDMQSLSTIDHIKLYGPWGNDEWISDFTIELYDSGNVLLGTENLTAPDQYTSGVILAFTQEYTNVSRIEFTITSSQGYSSANPERASLNEIVFLDLQPCVDADGDGIPNYLDLDSDNDGCLDALEGDGAFTELDLVTSGGTVMVGIGSTATNLNLCANSSCIDTDGVPTIASGGQGIGSAQDDTVSVCFCTQPGATGTPTEFTKVGISDREGAVSTWPGNVPNGFMAIQSEDSGFVITRLTTTQINNLDAVEGMLVYDTDEQCTKLYNGTAWDCIERSCNE